MAPTTAPAPVGRGATATGWSLQTCCGTATCWVLGVEGKFTPHLIFDEFTRAGSELWNNLLAPLSADRVAHWDQLAQFNQQIFTPYLVGGIIEGLPICIAIHYLTVPVIKAYHRHREKQMAERIARAKARRAREIAESTGR